MKTNSEPSIWLLIALIGFPQISETIYTPSLPDIARTFGIGNEWVNLTLSIYFIGFALGVLLWGRLSDRIGRRRAMLWGIGIYVLGCTACYASGNITLMVVSRFIQAFGASAGSVVTQTMMRDVFSGQRRSQVFSAVGGAIALAPAIGPFIGGYVDEWWGFYANFVVLFVMGVLLFAYCLKALPETRPEQPSTQTSVNLWGLASKMIRDSHVWVCAFLIAGCNGILFSYYGEAPFIFVELLGFTPSQYGLFGLVVAFAIVFASFLSHRLNAKMSSERVIGLGCSTMTLGSLLLLLCSQHLSVLWFMTPMMIIFVGMGLTIPNSISIALRSYQHVVGSAGAIFGLMYYVLIAFMTELMGIFHDGTMFPMPLYFVGLSIMMSVVFFAKEYLSLASLTTVTTRKRFFP
jgi:Bcr/CflA subfamily drug resistance transporter